MRQKSGSESSTWTNPLATTLPKVSRSLWKLNFWWTNHKPESWEVAQLHHCLQGQEASEGKHWNPAAYQQMLDYPLSQWEDTELQKNKNSNRNNTVNILSSTLWHQSLVLQSVLELYPNSQTFLLYSNLLSGT